jgi:hypothetical protein
MRWSLFLLMFSTILLFQVISQTVRTPDIVGTWSSDGVKIQPMCPNGNVAWTRPAMRVTFPKPDKNGAFRGTLGFIIGIHTKQFPLSGTVKVDGHISGTVAVAKVPLRDFEMKNLRFEGQFLQDRLTANVKASVSCGNKWGSVMFSFVGIRRPADTISLKKLASMPKALAIKALMFSQTSSQLVIGDDRGDLRLWDFKANRMEGLRAGSDFDRAVSIQSSPSGLRFATQYASGIEIRGPIDPTLLQAPGRLAYRSDKLQLGRMNARTFRQDGTQLAILEDGGAILDLETASVIRRFPQESEAPIVLVSFIHDDHDLLTVATDGTIRVWNLESGAKSNEFRVSLPALVSSTSLSFDDHYLAIGHANVDHTDISIINLETGLIQQTLSGHRNALEAVVFSPNGRFLASASHDHSARIWDLQTGKQALALTGMADVSSVAFSTDGQFFASGSFNSLEVYTAPTGLFR